MRFRLLSTLNQPKDAFPMALFRMIFGLLICAEAWGAIATGWVRRSFIDVDYGFPFIDFEWLTWLNDPHIYALYVIMGLAGLMVMMGYFYRISIIIYSLLWALVYFGQKTNYNNHYYLLLLLLIIMCFIPAHSAYSLDAKRRWKQAFLSIPNWCYLILIAQIAIVYTYGAVAKMYPDWWQLKPIKIWFAQKSDFPLLGAMMQEYWFQSMIAYGGIAFDLLIVPAMLWSKSRKVAFAISILFHGFNAIVFQVGIFPFLSLSWALFFFPEKDIRRWFLPKNAPVLPTHTRVYASPLKTFGLGIMLLYLLVQVALPLRHHLIASDVLKSEEGHKLSWRMMLRSKRGSVFFKVINKENGAEKIIYPAKYLSQKQAALVSTHPDFCWQFVQRLKSILAKENWKAVEIYAHGKISINGGPYQRLYRPDYDLATAQWSHTKSAEWIFGRMEKTK